MVEKVSHCATIRPENVTMGVLTCRDYGGIRLVCAN